MDNILINLDDGVRLGGSELPNVGEQSDIISQSDTLVGPPGPPGPQGPAGRDGEAATITVGTTTTGAAGTNALVQNSGTSSAAILEFTIPRGDKGDTGDRGPKGETGASGSDGEAATITVGSVTTVSSEYPATVTNSGTTSAAVLDFQIPQGIQGETGAAGPAGSDGQAATITVGSTTTGAAGTNASVTNSGTSSAAVLDFVIPRGDTGATGATGATGPAGSDGQAATITVGSTTTGAAGTNASVTNSGTSSAAVLDFTIPRGETGPQGPAGQDAVITEVHTTPSSSESYYAWKYPDGKMICFGTRTMTLNISSAYQGAYFASFTAVGFADTFIDTPIVNASILQNSTLLGINYTNITSTNFTGYIWKSTASNGVTLQIKYSAYGHWK